MWLPLLEITGLSAGLVGLHALRTRFGLAPLYLATGVLLAFMTIAGRLKLTVPMPTGPDASLAASYLALVLTAMCLVYTLEGTREARRFLGAIALGSLGLTILKLGVAGHLAGIDVEAFGRHRWDHPSLYGAGVSALALIADGIVIVIAYQALLNLPRLPVVVGLSLAQLAGSITDALVFGGLYGSLDAERFGSELLAKALTGVLASVPAALYISAQLRGASEQVRDGVLHRSALELVDLQRQLVDVHEALSRKEAEVEHVKEVFGRYVVPDVVDEILKDTSRLELGGKTAEVSIVFTDIRGYSTLSENMSPQQVIGLLNAYFGAMSDIIGRWRGTIIEFEGDAILAVFGAPLPQDDHATRAVRCTREMLKRVETLNEEWDADGTSALWKDLGLPSFRIRAGVHSGQVVVGNLGSQRRTKYAVIGDTVNVTARVEALNKTLRTTLLVTRQTADQVDGLAFVPLGTHTVKGRREPIEVLTLAELLDGSEAVNADELA